jgi:protein transport protein SEC13
MVSISQQIDTSHEDMIHDAVTDYFGTKLATCSSDRTIKLYSISGSTHTFLTDLRGHEGPVWQLSWAHPSFGNLIASCSYDRKVIVWREKHNSGQWEKSYEYCGHDSSVNAIEWAPKEFGLQLVCGSSDGALSVLTCIDNVWTTTKISNAHTIGVNAVCWAPAFSYGLSLFHEPSSNGETCDPPSSSGLSEQRDVNRLQKRFASAGCDNLIKIWLYDEKEDSWQKEHQLEAHLDWVRDIAWSPTIGTGKTLIASCSQDRKVIIWEQSRGSSSGNDGEPTWRPKPLGMFDDVVWHVSWSVMGNILAVSGGDNKVTLWKENSASVWQCISDVDNKST